MIVNLGNRKILMVTNGVGFDTITGLFIEGIILDQKPADPLESEVPPKAENGFVVRSVVSPDSDLPTREQ